MGCGRCYSNAAAAPGGLGVAWLMVVLGSGWEQSWSWYVSQPSHLVPVCAWLGCCFPAFKLPVFFCIGLLVQLGTWLGLPIGFVHLELWFPHGCLRLFGQLPAFRIGCFSVRS